MSQLENDNANYYGTDDISYDLDEYDNDGYEALFKNDDDFKVEVD